MLYDVLKISVPLTPRIFFGVMNSHFDKIMLGMISSIGGVGVYSIGQKVSYVVFQFMTALDRVFTPEVYRRLFSQEEGNEDRLIGPYLTPFAYYSVFSALLCVLFSEELFKYFFPDSYSDGVEIVIILAIYYASLFFGIITGTQLIFQKKTHITSVLNLVGIAINVVLNIPMIIWWGVTGAAIATLISGIINGLIAYKVTNRDLKIKLEWKRIVPIFMMLVLAAIWVIAMRAILFDEYVYRLSGKMAFVILFVWIGIYFELINKNKIVDLLGERLIKLIR
jgi:O-antigen/teichoic acid export membrane protein